MTDHDHYGEIRGATYHTEYTTFGFFRGQEVDPWIGQVGDPPQTKTASTSGCGWSRSG